jgi:hypothetical protein
MVNAILIPLTRQYHDSAGHINPVVDRMMDSYSGRGHRINYGHNMQGLIESFHLDGVEGVGAWFDHMIKDSMTPDGIPLPFAKAIKEITGMSTTDAIDWLCVTAPDVIGVGAEVAFLQLFKDNPKAYKLTVLIGTMIGIIDDNPLLVGLNALVIIKGLKNTGRLDFILNPAANALGKCLTVVSKVSIPIAVTNLGLGLIGLNVSKAVDNTISFLDNVPGISSLADWADAGLVLSDIIDGFTFLGINILAAKGIKHLFKKFNKDKQEEFEINQKKSFWQRILHNNVSNKASPSQMSVIIDMAEKNGVYMPVL